MRILVLTNLFPWPDHPERGVYNFQQLDGLRERAEIEAWVPVEWRRWRRAWAGERRAGEIPVRYFPFYYPPALLRGFHGECLYWSARSHLAALRDFGADCLLASFGYPDAVAGSLLAAALDLPLVVKLHGNDVNVMARGGGRRARRIVAALTAAERIVTVSRDLADSVTALGIDGTKLAVVYNGVDHERFRPGSEEASGDGEEQRIVYAGNLKMSKGCGDLIEAFAELARSRPDASLVLIGDGPDRARLEALAAAAGVAGRVRFTGRRPHAELAAAFREAALVCLASHAEGVPNVLLEAMACGTPVVATRVGGVPEIVPESAGMLVEPHDKAALAGALAAALERRWDRRAIAAAVADFDWTRSSAALAGVLREAAAGG